MTELLAIGKDLKNLTTETILNSNGSASIKLLGNTQYHPELRLDSIDVAAVLKGLTPVKKEEEHPVEKPIEEKHEETKSSMIVGCDIGGWIWEAALKDVSQAVKYVRTSSRSYSAIKLFREFGLTMLPLFEANGTLASVNNESFFKDIVAWFKFYGKGGTYWTGITDHGAITCELINEPGNPYFYSDYNNHALYAEITQKAYKSLETLPAANRPKLLVSYDGGYNGSAYGQAIFAAGAKADGVTVHSYGGHGTNSAEGNRARVEEAHKQTGLPVYITEVGWPTAVGKANTGDSLQWSEEQQAENIISWVKWCESLGYVNLTVNFNYADYEPNNYYGIVHTAGSPHKQSFAALQSVSGI